MRIAAGVADFGAEAVNMPNSEFCPRSFSSLERCAESAVESSCSNSDRRDNPTKSNEPDLISASSTFLLQARRSTSSQNCSSDGNRPIFCRASRTDSTALSPTPFTAPSPKRMFFPTTVKNMFDSFTSGGITSMPIDFASVMNFTT